MLVRLFAMNASFNCPGFQFGNWIKKNREDNLYLILEDHRLGWW